MMEKLPAIGTRVRLKHPHPWAGKRCRVVRHELTVIGKGAVVRIDANDAIDGHECFVFHGGQYTQDTTP